MSAHRLKTQSTMARKAEQREDEAEGYVASTVKKWGDAS